MDSVKNKKSSPDEFQAFTPKSQATFSTHQPSMPVGFAFSGSLWNSLISDPELRSQLEALVEQRVKERLDRGFEEFRGQVKEIARLEGLAQARMEVTAAVAQFGTRIEGICAEILREKERVLHDHEKQWCQALSHLLRRFLVPNAAEKLAAIESWLKESMQGFADKGKIYVYLPAEDMEKMQPFLPSGAQTKWEFRKDASMAPGEVRCECEGAGFIFSPNEQWKRLQEMLDRMTEGGQA